MTRGDGESRRRFLGRVVTLAAGGVWLSACQGSGTGSRPGSLSGSASRSSGLGAASASADPSPSPAPAPERPHPPTREPTLRVRVDRVRAGAGSAADPAVVTARDGWLQCRHLDREHRGTTLRGPVRVRFDRGGMTLADADGFRPPIDPHQPLELAVPRGHREELMWRGRRYPGSLVLHPVDDDERAGRGSLDGAERGIGVDVINHVLLESYLPGVLTGELYSHWEYDAFAAQAVAARSFACYEHLDRGERRHFDLTDSTVSQVYLGSAAHERAVEAVRRTRGQMLVYDGRLVPAYYSSCCGGLPANAIDSVSANPVNDIRPLRGQGRCWSCADSPVYRWRRTRTAGNVRRHLAAYGRSNGRDELASIGRVERIESVKQNRFGRPQWYAVHDGAGAVIEIEASDLRRALNVIGGRVVDDDARLRSSAFAVEVRDGAARFAGMGFGHGAGLCQYGAQGMAERGQPYGAILRWYYPGAQVKRVY